MYVLVLAALLALPSARCITPEEAKIALQKELEIWGKCAQQNNVSEKLLDDLIKHYEIPSTPNAKCLAACHLKGLNIMGEDGSLSWDKLDEVNRSEFHRTEDLDKSLQVTKECKAKVPPMTGSDHCEIAYVATKCFLDEAKRLKLPLITVDI